MRISKLRRTLAVFLSALMITLCVPFTAIRASAVSFVTSVTLSYSGTPLPTKLIAGENISNSINLNLNDFSATGLADGSHIDFTIEDVAVADSNGFLDTHYVANSDYYVCIVIRSNNGNIFNSDTSVNVDPSNTSLQGRNITFKFSSNLYGEIQLYLGKAESAEYTITFDANGGTGSPTSATTVSSKLSSLPTPTRDGFLFLGWYDSATGGNKITTSTTFNANKTIYAQWEHTNHNWSYSVSGNVITAKCSETACKYNTPGATLTLNAANADYTGSPYTGASVSADSGFPFTVTTSQIQYEGTGTTTYEKSATAPTNVGSYVAYVTAGDKTASKQFSINALTMTGISAASVTKTYDGNAYGIKVTGVPEGAVVKYGETSDGCTLSESPKYTNVGTYEIFYKVTKENYTDYINSARLIIDRADYTGEMTAEKEILAREVNENLTVALPAIPDNMSYGTLSFSSPVTAASITDGVLTFSTDNNPRDAEKYYIYVRVEGTDANYFDYDITVTLNSKACPHTNVETEWTYDDDGHWHKCPDCTSKRNYAEHTPAEAVKENVVDPTCTVDGSYDEVVYCSVCDYEISRTPKTTDATGHSFTNYISDGNADCLNDGTKTAECDNVCGETDTLPDVDSKTGHKWSTKYTYDKNYHWHECENANCPVTNDSDKDGYADHISSGEATEDNDEHCTVCGYVIKPALDHLCGRTELTFVPEVAETCTTDGTKAHYECRCGKLYSDKAAAAEVTAEDLRIPAHHVWSETWSHDEAQHYHLCTVCDEKNDTTLHTYGDWTITKLATPTADGEKERSCSVCGYVQTGVVNYIPDNTDNDTGDINNTTDADSNACHGDTELTKSEIIEKIDLTPEELTAVENGEDINIFLTVEDNSANVSESDKTLTESVLNNDDTIAMYLDIKLFKQVGENSPTQITNTNGDVTIVFEMPESIICTDKNVTREYFIIRVHEGTAETLKCTFDPATGKASFMTDKFSSYAIVYKDTVNMEPDPVTNDAEEAAEDIEMILDDFTPDNDTTAEDILSEIEDVVNDYYVTVEIISIEIVPATEDSEGSITVTIVITDSEGNTETVVKEIVIPKLPKHEKPAVTIYYPVITSGNVSADRSSAAAGETVNVKASFGYDIIVTAANGRQIAKMTENGSFVMPASKVYVTAVQNETFALMATAWRNSYVYSYDSDMNKIKVSSTKKQGVIVVNLGEDYAGKSFTIYSGRKSTKVKVTEGVLDEKGKFVFEVPDGRNYTLVVED